MCDCKTKDYARLQQATYDIQNNTILYGTSNQIGSLGVSDGSTNQKCNVFDDMVYKKPCSAFIGTAGGNPCTDKNYKNYEKYKTTKLNSKENFENKKHNGYNITMIINIILILLLIFIVTKLYHISTN